MDEGRRFTDEYYATKDEVKAAYNQNNIDTIWDKVLSYRSFFDVETDLSDINSNHYKVCLTKGLLAKSYNLQLALSRMMVDYNKLNDDFKGHFALNQLDKALTATARFENINITENTIHKISTGEIENLSTNLFPLKAYDNAYRYALSFDCFNLQSIENINKLLIGQELELAPQYRKSNPMNIINPLLAPDSSYIQEHIDRLFSFLRQEEIPLVLRALGIVYVLTYLRPFEYANEETAGLCAKAFLGSNNLLLPSFSLPFESLSYTISASYFRRLKNSEETLDLTYFFEATLPFLIFESQKIDQELHETIVKQVEVTTEVLPTGENTNSENNFIASQDTFALPDFPLSIDHTKIDAVAKKLLEIYPQLKKKQAHFYAGHCQVGFHYTIEQFKKEEKTVYETARTSMEDLANRGFYKKELIGKKFVYTPIPIKD